MKKVILITGITGRLGRCFSEKFGGMYTLVGIARRPPEKNGDYDFIAGDVYNTSHDYLVDRVLSNHRKIDVLINNAVYSRWDHTSKISYADFACQLAVNVAAPLSLSNACYHKFWSQRPSAENREHNRGVIQVGSIAGVNDYLGYGQGTYAATKSALHTLTRHMADDYKEFGLKVNALAPNSFPSLISTEAVCDGIHALINGEHTGKIMVMDSNKNYLL